MYERAHADFFGLLRLVPHVDLARLVFTNEDDGEAGGEAFVLTQFGNLFLHPVRSGFCDLPTVDDCSSMQRHPGSGVKAAARPQGSSWAMAAGSPAMPMVFLRPEVPATISGGDFGNLHSRDSSSIAAVFACPPSAAARTAILDRIRPSASHIFLRSASLRAPASRGRAPQCRAAKPRQTSRAQGQRGLRKGCDIKTAQKLLHEH